jgi:hypothetical protein
MYLYINAAKAVEQVNAAGQRPLERGTLFQDRDYPVLNDYRAVLGGLFRSLWSLSPNQMSRVFENDYRAVLGGLFRSLWSLSPNQMSRVFERTSFVDLGLV